MPLLPEEEEIETAGKNQKRKRRIEGKGWVESEMGKREFGKG